jgi:hypothetical protein
MAIATIKTTATTVALTRMLLKYSGGFMSKDDFVKAAAALGFTPERDPDSFIRFAVEQAIKMLDTD